MEEPISRERELTGKESDVNSFTHSICEEAKLLVSPFLISRSKSICFLTEELRSELGGGSPAKTEKDSERTRREMRPTLWKLKFTGEFALNKFSITKTCQKGPKYFRRLSLNGVPLYFSTVSILSFLVNISSFFTSRLHLFPHYSMHPNYSLRSL